jgi:hypothetical protein
VFDWGNQDTVVKINTRSGFSLVVGMFGIRGKGKISTVNIKMQFLLNL